MCRICTHLIWFVLLTELALSAGVPQAINYQGRVTDSLGNPIADVEHDIVFSIYEDDMSPTVLWTSGILSGTPTNGFISAHLGPVPAEVFTSGNQRYLGITVDGGPEMIPRIEITSMPYAYKSLVADTALYAYAAPASPDDDWAFSGDNIYRETGKIGIRNADPANTLTIGNNMVELPGSDYVTVCNPTGNSGFIFGEDQLYFGFLDWNSSQNLLSLTTSPAGRGLRIHDGNVGIGISWGIMPQEALVVGKDLGSFSGERIVIGDDRAGVQTGLVIGKDSNNRGWSLWDVDNNYLTLGTRESGNTYGNTMVLQRGCVGFNIEAADYTVLRVDKDYNTSLARYGIVTHVKNSSSSDMFGLWSRAEHLNPTTPLKHIYGVYGIGWADSTGIVGPITYGVKGYASGGTQSIGIYGEASRAYDQQAGHFEGRVDIYGRTNVYGTLYKTSGAFRIDHPIDPENKYLQHSFVESPDMMNIYNGNVILDENGEAVVLMPDWFEPLNGDFRYQLTCIGGFEPVYISEEMNNGKFSIAGGEPGLKVSWQVTGIRHDRWAEENRIPVEVDKEGKDRGRYLHPEVLGKSEEMRTDYEIRTEMSELSQAER